MDCRLITGELFAYALGTSSDDERDRIDAHLLTCTGCLRAYLRLKSHVERGASSSARPSEATRRRIRDDVGALVRPRGTARLTHWLRRPIPLYQGLAVAAVAAGVAFGLPHAMTALEKRPAETTARIDTSKPVPQALAVY